MNNDNSLKQPLIGFFCSTKNSSSSIQQQQQFDNKTIDPKSIGDFYKEIITQSPSPSSSSRWKTKTKAKTNSNRMLKFYCDACKQNVQSISIHSHNLSIEHQFRSNQFSEIDTSYAQYAHLNRSDNRGYQLLRKQGWSGCSGLGRQEQGRKFPLKTVKKQDRKGVGYQQQTNDESKETSTNRQQPLFVRKDQIRRRQNYERSLEIEFRRQFIDDGII
ncbi:uncharacterized protein LOC113789541 [Dermatophagoides pteronyssinus]|uniref:G patch domain and ankyrin repeat-containing protein 1 n=2 Tax=Dermatophagoides pteronyssinus TaxID=6956 RepID=A0ABQ8JSZ4_DERPT|nr:G patch domain and ankyrin repeat-containing protein 1 homolog [Dermatophagoides pteronyssinus]KAH9425723.1 G patch domain and ankyrin repeat-containing protein 1 [Dermatophagoides pteronyssinus]